MLKFLTSGESHGRQLTAIVDGFPAGFKVDVDKVNYQLSRRQKGYGRGGRMKIEKDQVDVVSGLRHGFTLGSPITLVIRNLDWENWARIMDPIAPLPQDLTPREQQRMQDISKPRPGHADLAGAIKLNHKDMRNVLERASARETAARVAVGALCRQLLESFSVQFAGHVVSIGEVALPDGYDISDLTRLNQIAEESEVRCIDKATEQMMIDAIKAAKNSRDSLGGIVEVIVRGLPAGLGGFSQPEHRLDSPLAAALMAIPSVKGVEIGLGFRGAERRGSKVHDEIFYEKGSNPVKKDFFRKTNNAGGLEGGMTNGEDLVVRAAGKPISTLNQPLRTVDVVTKKPAEAMVERTDNCVTPALTVVCEAAVAIVLADHFFRKFGSDNMDEIKRNYQSYLDASF